MELVYGADVITLDDYLTIKKWQALQKDFKTFTKTPADILSFYTGLSVNKIKKLPKDDVNFILSYVTNQLVDVQEDVLVKTFTHNGVTYGVEMEFGKLPWGAWQDFEILSAQDIESNVHKLMAILYRPVISQKGDKYKIVPYEPEEIAERAEEFLELPINYWFGVSGFFLQIAELSITDIKSFLDIQTKMMRWTERGWRMLPKWLQRRLPLDTILHSHLTSLMRILPKSRR